MGPIWAMFILNSNTSEWYQQNIEIPFFNYFLKGKGDISKISEAVIFITGENSWHDFDQWPPEKKMDKNIFLQENGGLGLELTRR